jgi:hypothetical protein
LTKSATFAASHFVWFLPEGSIVSIDTFSDTYSQLQTPVALNVNTKNTILSHLGELAIKSTTNTAGLSLALDNAMQVIYNTIRFDSISNIEINSSYII